MPKQQPDIDAPGFELSTMPGEHGHAGDLLDIIGRAATGITMTRFVARSSTETIAACRIVATTCRDALTEWLNRTTAKRDQN